MIAVASYTEDGAKQGIDPVDISEIVGRDGTLVWVDLIDPTTDELECVRDEFSLHHLAMEDATKHGQRPKLERYPRSSTSSVATLIAGIYGMNFQHIPEFGWKLGYAWALGLTALLTTVGYALFRRRNWL